MADTFTGVNTFAFMVALILLATLLRANVSWLQKSLIPASLLGGLAGFVLLSFEDLVPYQSEDFVGFAFHFFTLSFMSLVLTGREAGTEPRAIRQGGLWMSFGWTSSLVLQALVGLTIIAVYNEVSDGDLSLYLGALVTHGFTQGPGQALAMGSIWEQEFAVNNAISFGLIYASMGFIMSFLIGVPVARYAIHRGLNQNLSARLTGEFERGLHDLASRPSAGSQVTHSANVDSLVFHLGILGVAYLVTDQYLQFMQGVTEGVTLGGLPIGVFFSYNLFFLHGLIVCLIIRSQMDSWGIGHYIDDDTQKRITGSAVDLMMAATVMSIEFSLLAAYAGPIFLVCFAVAVVTGIMCYFFGRMLNHLSVERALALFGCCTGSTGSGLLLLRILDPDLTTSVGRELAYFNVAIVFLSIHVLGIMAPVLPAIDLWVVCGVYAATFVIGAVALRVLALRT